MARGIVQNRESNELVIMKDAHHELNCLIMGDRGEQVDTSLGTFQGLIYSDEARSTLEDTIDIANEVLVLDNNYTADVGSTRYLYLRYRYPNTAPTWDIDAIQVAHLKMNDAEFTTPVIDEEGGTWTASVNTVMLAEAGHINGSFKFADSLEYITGPALESAFQAPFSIAFWAKPDDGQPATVEAFLGKRDDGATMAVEVNVQTDGKIQVKYNDGTTSVTAKTNVAVFTDGAQTWHHVVVIVPGPASATSAGFIKIYFDNVDQTLDAVENGDLEFTVMANYSDPSALMVGTSADADVLELPYLGELDDLRITARALTATEVSALYNSGAGTEDNTDGAEGNVIIGTNPCTLSIK